MTPRTKAILPVHLAGQPCRPRAAAGSSASRSSRTRRTPSSRPTAGRKLGALSDATCFSLYATKNVAAGEGGLVATNRDDVAAAIDDLRVMRRGHGSLYDIPVPGYKANLSDVLASIALVQLGKLARAPRDPRAALRRVRRGRGRAARDRAARPRPARHARAPPLRRARRPRARGRRRATTTSACSPRSRSARASTSCRCTPLSAYREPPRRPAAPVAERAGAEVLSLPLSPAHSDEDIADAIAALRRVHARLVGK